MKMNRCCFALAVFIGSLQLVSAADITGKMTLTGTPPPEKELPLDPTCGKTRSDKPTTRFYIVGPGGGLADVFVYLKEGVANKPAPSAKPAVLDQKGCEYIPYVIGLQTKQKLLVKNSDPVLHNVHPTPAVAGNKESNRAQLPNGPDQEYAFDNPEVLLRYKCDVHPWMFAYVGVVDHPYFAVSAKDGTFKIPNVPPGTYTIEAFHRKGGTQTQKITVDGSKTVDFKFEVKTQ